MRGATDTPLAFALPPLVHPNMAAIVGFSKNNKKAFRSSQASAFSSVVSSEILHGVTLQQLHQRVAQKLRRRREVEEKILAQATIMSLGDEKSLQVKETTTKIMQKGETVIPAVDAMKQKQLEKEPQVDACVSEAPSPDNPHMEKPKSESAVTELHQASNSKTYKPVYCSEDESIEHESFAEIRAKFDTALKKLSPTEPEGPNTKNVKSVGKSDDTRVDNHTLNSNP
ncbi:uncharacterized protein LOC108680041, partial [Hyalella azteca]|uniref:Uncharacterized protein LOC108680041 n=1 Tax=Hyalella azteca TaxID=294128 RepID=A0A8B7PE58_HYAAZ